MNATTAPADEIADAAARWHLRLAEPGCPEEDAEACRRWRDADPRHRAAFEEMGAMLAAVDRLGESPAGDRFRSEALAGATARTRWRLWLAPVAAAMLCLALATPLLWREAPAVQAFQTPLDRRGTVVLADGSRVTLDSFTRILVTIGDDDRRVELVRGQARFKVAHDAGRRFRVVAGARAVVATGTDFNVERMDDRSIVSLIEGGVIVVPAAEPGILERWSGTASALPAPVRLRPGDMLDVPDSGAATLRRADPADVVAWEQGILVFEDERLDRAIQRINRYSRRRIVIDDPAVAAMRITGAFEARSPAATVEALAQFLHLQAASRPDGMILLGKGG